MKRILLLIAVLLTMGFQDEQPEEIETPEPEVTLAPEIKFEPMVIFVCRDKRAMNYDGSKSSDVIKLKDGGECVYLEGCTDPCAVNFLDGGGEYVKDDGTCWYPDGYSKNCNAEPEEQEAPELWIMPEDEPEDLEFYYGCWTLEECDPTLWIFE